MLSVNRPAIVIGLATTIVTVSKPVTPKESVATIVSIYDPAVSAPVTRSVLVAVSKIIAAFVEVLRRVSVPVPPEAVKATVVSPRVNVVVMLFPPITTIGPLISIVIPTEPVAPAESVAMIVSS